MKVQLEKLFDELFNEAEEAYKTLFEYKKGIKNISSMQRELKITELRGYTQGIRYALEKVTKMEENINE